MTSSNWTAQLSLWQEIVSQFHGGSRPLNQHYDFMRTRFDELDAEGFIWSRESILDTFLHLGLSARTHGASLSVNNETEPHLSQGVEISSDEVQTVIHNDQLQHQSRRVGLMDLPIEIFYEILAQIYHLPSNLVHDRRAQGEVNVTGPGDMAPYWTYLYRDSPILSPTQSFSLTSREIYRRCKPWLWQRLIFPTAFPAPVNLWTKDILLKQGSHVQSLSLRLSENCYKPPGEFMHYDPFYDNLAMECNPDLEPISPQNVKDLIGLCPNLSSLEMDYGYEEPSENEGGTEAFLLDLLPLLSNLKQLQHLKLVDAWHGTVMKEFPSKVVGLLPLLESLTIRVSTVSEDQPTLDGSFGFKLSKLKYLSRLELEDVGYVDESWCLHDWPEKITDLEIIRCADLKPSSVQRIVHHIAPHLTSLTLYFGYGSDDRWEMEPSWNPASHLSFPSLTDLKLSTRDPYFLASFQDCKSLRYLEWPCKTFKHVRVLKNNLLEATWPQIKRLEGRGYRLSLSDLPNQEIEDELRLLENCCRQMNVQAIIRRPFT